MSEKTIKNLEKITEDFTKYVEEIVFATHNDDLEKLESTIKEFDIFFMRFISKFISYQYVLEKVVEINKKYSSDKEYTSFIETLLQPMDSMEVALFNNIVNKDEGFSF